MVISGTGFAVRLIYLLQARQHDPLFFAPQMDAEYHHRWALAIVSNTEFIRDAFFRAPLYPYFLAGLYKLGLGLFGARVAQVVLGSASCGFVFLLARRLLKSRQQATGLADRTRERVAVASGLVMAAYPLAVYFDGELLIPSLLVFLVLLGMVLLYRSLENGRQWWLPGLVFGLAAIARPNVLAFVAVFAVWLLVKYRSKVWSRLGWFLGAVCIVIAPVTVRNYVVSGTFVPIAWQAGTNFYIGNNPESDGVTAIVPGTRGSWWGGYFDVKTQAEKALGRELKGAEIDRYWLGQGLDFWRKQPLRALWLVVRKTYLLLSGYEVSNNRNIYYYKRFTFLSLLIFQTVFLKFPFGLLLPLALVGIYLGRSIARRWMPVFLFLVSFGLSFVAFFVTARYRMPMVPFLIVLAVYGVTRLAKARGRELGIGLALLAGALVFFNAGLFGAGRAGVLGPGRVEDQAQTHLSAAMGMFQQGRLADALGEVRTALEYDSAENVLVLESAIYVEMGKLEQARVAAQAAVDRFPSSPEPYGQLGNVFARAGQLDSARLCFEKVCELDPNSASSWNNLGNIAMMQSDFTSARTYFEKALAIEPTFVIALFNLGLLDWQEGNRDLARSRWKRALELDPSYTKAKQALEYFRQ